MKALINAVISAYKYFIEGTQLMRAWFECLDSLEKGERNEKYK